MGCDPGFKMQLERFAKIGQSLRFGAALTGNIYVKALRYKPFALPESTNRYPARAGSRAQFDSQVFATDRGQYPSDSDFAESSDAFD
jgi:hypothetical protein